MAQGTSRNQVAIDLSPDAARVFWSTSRTDFVAIRVQRDPSEDLVFSFQYFAHSDAPGSPVLTFLHEIDTETFLTHLSTIDLAYEQEGGVYDGTDDAASDAAQETLFQEISPTKWMHIRLRRRFVTVEFVEIVDSAETSTELVIPVGFAWALFRGVEALRHLNQTRDLPQQAAEDLLDVWHDQQGIIQLQQNAKNNNDNMPQELITEPEQGNANEGEQENTNNVAEEDSDSEVEQDQELVETNQDFFWLEHIESDLDPAADTDSQSDGNSEAGSDSD